MYTFSDASCSPGPDWPGLQGAFHVSSAMGIPQSGPFALAMGIPQQAPKLYGGVFGDRAPSLGMMPLGAPQPLSAPFVQQPWQQYRAPDPHHAFR